MHYHIWVYEIAASVLVVGRQELDVPVRSGPAGVSVVSGFELRTSTSSLTGNPDSHQ